VSTTEVFVEQVIMGAMVLVVVGLLAFDDLVDWLFGADLGSLAVAAAMAYLAGILFDRMADTILGRLERHHRLQFAAREAKRNSHAGQATGEASDDPFPEERWRLGMFRSEGAAGYADYLRSRIRLTRSVAVAAPALALGLSAHLMRHPVSEWTSMSWVAVGAVVVAYTLVTFRRASGAGEVLRREYADPPKAERQDAPLWTSDMKDDKIRGAYEGAYEKDTKSAGLLSFIWISDRELTLWTIGLCALAFAISALAGRAGLGALIGLGGAALTLLAGWSWWRINQTFYELLRDFNSLALPSAAERASSLR
jgi:hypothetical protein